MIGPDEDEKLFCEIVQPKIHLFPSGLIEYPLDALREYSKVSGNSGRFFYYYMAREEKYDDSFSFCLGLDCDKNATVKVGKVYFNDCERGLLEPIRAGKYLRDKLVRCFYDGGMILSNEAIIDKDGGLHLRGLYSDDIIADYRITFPDGSFGYSLHELDGGANHRLWRNGNVFCCTQTQVFFYYDGEFQ